MSVTMHADAARPWQPAFLTLLPVLEQHAQQATAKYPRHEREEARQAILTYAAVAFARLVELNKAQLAFPASLVKFGLKHYRAGRVVGNSTNCRDVGSVSCLRKQGCSVEPLDEWTAALVDSRGVTPADIA